MFSELQVSGLIGEEPIEGLGSVLGWRMGCFRLAASGAMCSMMALRRISGPWKSTSTGMRASKSGRANGPLHALFKAMQAQMSAPTCILVYYVGSKDDHALHVARQHYEDL